MNEVSSGVQAWAFLEAIDSINFCLYDWAAALKPDSILYAIDPKFDRLSFSKELETLIYKFSICVFSAVQMCQGFNNKIFRRRQQGYQHCCNIENIAMADQMQLYCSQMVTHCTSGLQCSFVWFESSTQCHINSAFLSGSSQAMCFCQQSSHPFQDFAPSAPHT